MVDGDGDPTLRRHPEARETEETSCCSSSIIDGWSLPVHPSGLSRVPRASEPVGSHFTRDGCILEGERDQNKQVRDREIVRAARNHTKEEDGIRHRTQRDDAVCACKKWKKRQPKRDALEILVDETSVDTAMVRAHGRAKRGKRFSTLHQRWSGQSPQSKLRQLAPGLAVLDAD